MLPLSYKVYKLVLFRGEFRSVARGCKRGHPRQCRGSGVRSLIGSKTDSWGIWPGAPEISYLWPNIGPLSYSILGPHMLRVSTACVLMLDPTWPVLPYCPPLTQPPPVLLYLSPPFIELSLVI